MTAQPEPDPQVDHEVTSLARECLICSATQDLTVEHIIPQTLWKRFGVDPNAKDGGVPLTRTTLCSPCNKATSALHQRTEMMTFIETGAPISRRTLAHASDWFFWVLLLLGLARGATIMPLGEARELLNQRFGGPSAVSMPRGIRVYAARAESLETQEADAAVSYGVALVGDPGIYTNEDGAAIGMAMAEGQPLQLSSSIGLGRLVVLVLGRTHNSGEGHDDRLDEAAATGGLTRIHPPAEHVPTLEERAVDLAVVRNLFVSPFAADNLTLLPSGLRSLFALIRQERSEAPTSPA